MAPNRMLLSVLENVTKLFIEITWLEMQGFAKVARIYGVCVCVCVHIHMLCYGYTRRHVLARNRIIIYTAAMTDHSLLFNIVASGYCEQEYVFVNESVYIDFAGAMVDELCWTIAKLSIIGGELLC